MTFFEYAMVMVSIMLAIGLSQLLRAIGDIILSPRRHWPHLGWIAAMVIVTVQVWWAYWDMHEGVDWTFGLYGFVLVGPALILVAANLLVPVARTEETDWREHFEGARRPFLTVLITFQVFAILFTWIAMDVSLLRPFRLAQASLVCIVLVALVSRSPRVQAAAPAAYLTGVIAANILFRAYPAAFGLGS